MTQQERFNSIEDRWLEPPEGDVLFMCDCCARDIYEISALSIIPGDNTTYILLEGEECAANDEQKAEFLSLYKEL